MILDIVAEIRQRIELRCKRLEQGLESVIPQLVAMGAVRVVLFGSLAQGDVDTDSDLDLLMIMPDSLSGKDWLNRVYSTVDRRVETEVVSPGQSWQWSAAR